MSTQHAGVVLQSVPWALAVDPDQRVAGEFTRGAVLHDDPIEPPAASGLSRLKGSDPFWAENLVLDLEVVYRRVIDGFCHPDDRCEHLVRSGPWHLQQFILSGAFARVFELAVEPLPVQRSEAGTARHFLRGAVEPHRLREGNGARLVVSVGDHQCATFFTYTLYARLKELPAEATPACQRVHGHLEQGEMRVIPRREEDLCEADHAAALVPREGADRPIAVPSVPNVRGEGRDRRLQLVRAVHRASGVEQRDGAGDVAAADLVRFEPGDFHISMRAPGGTGAPLIIDLPWPLVAHVLRVARSAAWPLPSLTHRRSIATRFVWMASSPDSPNTSDAEAPSLSSTQRPCLSTRVRASAPSWSDRRSTTSARPGIPSSRSARSSSRSSIGTPTSTATWSATPDVGYGRVQGGRASLRQGATAGDVGPAGLARLDGAGREVARHVLRRGVGMMRRLGEMGEQKAALQLTTDLLGQCVAVLECGAGAIQAGALLGGGMRDVGEREAMAHDELASSVEQLEVEQVDVRVHEASQQRATWPQHPEALSPHRPQLWGEEVRDRVEDQIEAAVLKGAQIPHIAKDGAQRKVIPPGDALVLLQLAR